MTQELNCSEIVSIVGQVRHCRQIVGLATETKTHGVKNDRFPSRALIETVVDSELVDIGLLGLRVGCVYSGAGEMLLWKENTRVRRFGQGQWCVGNGFHWSTICVAILLSSTVAAAANYPDEPLKLGINYGRVGDNLPTANATVKLIQGLGGGIGRVRIFDHDGPTIAAFAGSGLDLLIGLGNNEIGPLVDASEADAWVAANIVPYYPATNIVYILVGNELFADSTLSATTWLQLVPAIQNLHTSLATHNLSAIKVSTAAEYSILSLSYPPSKGVFRTDIATQVLTPLLQYLDSTSSYLFINVYPYFGWSSNSQYIPLDYALFTRSSSFYNDSQYEYYNLLDAQLDAMVAAMAAVGYGNVRIAISETGWPTAGDSNEHGANVSNAQTYNQNLVRHVLDTPTSGTPMRPGVFIPTFIFALFNEDLKTGASTERNWGLLYPSGAPVYPIDFTSSTSSGGGSPGAGGGGGDEAENTCRGKPSVLPMSVSILGTLFNLRI